MQKVIILYSHYYRRSIFLCSLPQKTIRPLWKSLNTTHRSLLHAKTKLFSKNEIMKLSVVLCSPWYVEVATSVEKDVVILIDQSVASDVIDISKEAARTVLDTMNPNDRVRSC